MQTDFYDAHQRHWEDAELLFNSLRFANADHLYGYAAECGLKSLMIAWNMPVNASGCPTELSDRVHVNKVWDRYETYRSNHFAAHYILPSQNPFLNWDVSQRYVHQSNFGETTVAVHQQAARAVQELVTTARRNGIL